MDESCQSLLFQSDISYDRTEDDVVRNDPLKVLGFSFSPAVSGWFCPTPAVGQPPCIAMVRGGLPQMAVGATDGYWRFFLALCSPDSPSLPSAFQDVDMTTVVRTLKRKSQERQVGGKC